MLFRSANAATLLAGICWGAGLSTPVGVWLGWLGAAAFAGMLRGDLRRDLARGLVVGMLTAALWYRELPQIWNTYGGSGGIWLYLALVPVQAIPLGIAAAAAGQYDEDERWIGLGLSLAATTLLVHLLPVPVDLAILGTSWAPSLWPVALAGTSGFALLLGVFGGLAQQRSRWAAALLAGWLVLGAAWHAVPLPEANVAVSLVQPDIDPFDARRSSTARERASRVLRLVHASQGLPLVPETAWPFRELPSPAAVFGHVGPAPSNRLSYGEHSFDKRVLLPVAETPFLGVGDTHFEPGPRPRALPVDGLVFAPLICFEDLTASALWEAARDGGGPLLLATNDGWLGLAGDKHLAGSVLAAVRTRRWAARPANSGPSAIIDPRGRIVARTASVDWPDGEGQVLEGRIGTAAPALSGILVEPFLAVLCALTLFLRLRR
ncbi:MAG: hypothetical protein EP330_19170 [Deltaproteobacteria bacterium]|nr:MAG: hypothetical protein EP330_19170 [Deltaproteobacteria bacterium]